MVVADDSAGNCRVLPDVQVVDLGYGDVEFPVESAQQRFDAAAFFLERCATGYMNVQDK